MLTTQDKQKIRKVFQYCDAHYSRKWVYEIRIRAWEIMLHLPGTTSRASIPFEDGADPQAFAREIRDFALGYMSRRLKTPEAELQKRVEIIR